MSKFALLKIASAAVLATAAMAAQAAGPDWSLIISGPGVVVPPAPAQVTAVRPVVVAPPPAIPAPVQTTAIQGARPDNTWERDRERERDKHFQENFQSRFQERENYFMERERAFMAREKAFLEREKQRQLVVENNMKATQAVNDRQDQQLDMIVQGVNVGTIDKDEFTALMAQQKAIRERERAFLADGFLAQDEYNALTTDLNNTEQAIRFAARPERPRREPGRYYYPQQAPQNR